MRLWFRRGRRGPGDGRTALNPPGGVAATAPEGNLAPAEDPVRESEPTPVPAAEPVPPAVAVTEAKSARRSKHGKKAARAAGSPPADPFDRALDRLRTEIPATEDDGFR